MNQSEVDTSGHRARTIAMGDIHGSLAALDALLEAIVLQPDDTLVTLGDYVDRGVDSKGVLDRLLELSERCRLVPLLGNHEEMMQHARGSRVDLQFWLNCGGEATLASYGEDARIGDVPREHFQFLESCLRCYETPSHIFLHANYKPDVPLAQLDDYTVRWLSLRDYVPDRPHGSGKTVIVGHTPRPEVFDLGYLVCIDTGIYQGGWLTAMDVESKQIWQADDRGRLRN